MGLSRQQQRQIMRDDAKRRNAREAAEIEAIVAAHSKIQEGIDPYLFSRSIGEYRQKTIGSTKLRRTVGIADSATQR
jgi:hypothetical protein